MGTDSPGDLIDEHADAVEPHYRYSGVRFGGRVEWDLRHLDAFAFPVEIEASLVVSVVVLFSCHCFTHAEEDDDRCGQIPLSEYYRDGREVRVLDEERYELSRQHLRAMIRDLPNRQVRVQAPASNFFTLKSVDSQGKAVEYLVVFEVEKDRKRQKRLLLRVQTAYPAERLSKRQQNAGKVRFPVLLRAAYQGRKIRA